MNVCYLIFLLEFLAMTPFSQEVRGQKPPHRTVATSPLFGDILRALFHPPPTTLTILLTYPGTFFLAPWYSNDEKTFLIFLWYFTFKFQAEQPA